MFGINLNDQKEKVIRKYDGHCSNMVEYTKTLFTGNKTKIVCMMTSRILGEEQTRGEGM